MATLEVEKLDPTGFLINLDKRKIWNVKQDQTAVFCDTSFVMSFGYLDLQVKNYFYRDGGISNFPQNYGDDKTVKLELTNGQSEFEIDELEVYHIHFYDEFEEENEKLGRHNPDK